MAAERDLNIRDWYFGFQCRNQSCQQNVPLFEVDHRVPFQIVKSTGMALVRCPHCSQEASYPLEQGWLLRVEPQAKS